ncbi:GntP family permease [Thiopseudomonas alkaliphila]|uniref:GntP family permease n=1 Tax=Thiopseudomonas alkaliphila TaxID=1697053 RepID=UPI00069EAFDD|nr:GntP family permease [Thiopseudomonas alkaliphila]AKX51701.1 citrate transporter [Thiopseudomonas alkaliphila]AKX58037.1 citrate transporter [Thiopseudomonas alkaliphila]MDM1717068.1 GntP family permease [Thiopseudomonas alkaliphila]
MLTISYLGLLAGLALLVFMTMRGIGIIFSAIVCAILVALTSGMDLSIAMLDYYMKGFTGFFTTWFPAILLGAIFGRLMDDSGAALAIANKSKQVLGAKRAIMAVVGAGAILTYGGVSVFVVGFTLYPIAFELFRSANIAHRFIPAAIIFGSISFTMVSPGSPEIQNLIPTTYFGTTATAGGIIGVLMGLLIMVSGGYALKWMANRATARGENFDLPADYGEAAVSQESAVSFISAITPLIILVGGFNLLSHYIPVIEALLVAMIASLTIGYLLFIKTINSPGKMISTGSENALIAIANTCAVVGFGAVAAQSPAFGNIVAVLTNMPGLEYAGLAVAVTVIAGITGSASGGLGIALPILAPIYQSMGLDNGAMHRISAIASGGLDSLPHNGYVVTTIRAICKETHQRAYPAVFLVSVLIPLPVLAIAVLLYSLFY